MNLSSCLSMSQWGCYEQVLIPNYIHPPALFTGNSFDNLGITLINSPSFHSVLCLPPTIPYNDSCTAAPVEWARLITRWLTMCKEEPIVFLGLSGIIEYLYRQNCLRPKIISLDEKLNLESESAASFMGEDVECSHTHGRLIHYN